MRNRKFISLLVFFCFLFATALFLYKKQILDKDTHLSITEDQRQLSINANYPVAISSEVHEYLKHQLHLSDLPDLRNLEIKEYHVPDGSMTFHIKSRNGFVKILMNKKINNEMAYQKIKATGAGLNEILTRQTPHSQ